MYSKYMEFEVLLTIRNYNVVSHNGITEGENYIIYHSPLSLTQCFVHSR